MWGPTPKSRSGSTRTPQSWMQEVVCFCRASSMHTRIRCLRARASMSLRSEVKERRTRKSPRVVVEFSRPSIERALQLLMSWLRQVAGMQNGFCEAGRQQSKRSRVTGYRSRMSSRSCARSSDSIMRLRFVTCRLF